MTIEQKREAVCTVMGFRDPGFLKWLDGCREAEELLIKREQEAGANAAHPFYACWDRYVTTLEDITAGTYGGPIHANVEQRLDAFLKTIGAMP